MRSALVVIVRLVSCVALTKNLIKVLLKQKDTSYIVPLSTNGHITGTMNATFLH